MPPNGIINQSMRENYNSYGVENYYNLVQESYRNPHFPGLKKCLAQLMDNFVIKERPKFIKVLDLAAGSGEATEALLSWKSSRWPPPSNSPNSSSTSTRLPPVIQPRQPFIPPSRTIVRPQRSTTTSTTNSSSIPEPPLLSITATDPYTSPAYRQRTGLPCLQLSFNQVAQGELPLPTLEGVKTTAALGQGDRQEEEEEDSGLNQETKVEEEEQEEEKELYDLVIVSFALHLVETSSELWALLTELKKISKWLCVIAPHKKPDIKSSWGWTRWDPSLKNWGPARGRGNVGGTEGDGFEIVLDRVRLRLWRSEEN